MKLRLLLPLLALSCACSSRHSAVSSTYDFSGLKRIAVAGFDSSGVQLNGVEDMVTRALLEKGFSVVERSELDRIIKEQKIAAQGYITADTARELGKILGVDGFLLGKVSSYTPEKQDVAMIEATSVRVEQPSQQPPHPHREGGNRPMGSPNDPGPAFPQPAPAVTTTVKRIPHVYNKYAQVGLTMRLVDTQTGEVVWAGSYTTEGVNGAAAAEYSANYLVDTFYRDIRKKMNEAKSTDFKDNRR